MPISLSKGQKISLEKEAGKGLSRVIMGLGWDQKKSEKSGFFGGFFGGGKAIDLDGSCLMFDESKKLVDTVWFKQLRSKDGSIQHSGDDRTGGGEGDDEQITVSLTSIPSQVKQLIFTINSFTGQTFQSVNNAYCRIVNQSDGQEIARYNLTAGGRYTAQIMAKLYWQDGEWKMQALGEGAEGKTFHDMMPLLQAQL